MVKAVLRGYKKKHSQSYSDSAVGLHPSVTSQSILSHRHNTLSANPVIKLPVWFKAYRYVLAL